MDIGAGQAQAGFQAQGIAGAKAHRRHPRVGQQQAGEGLGGRGGHGNLEAVLAGIARTGDQGGYAGNEGVAHVHEAHAGNGVAVRGQYSGRGRPLQREQGLVGQRAHFAVPVQAGTQVIEIGGLERRVDHQVQPAGQSRDHEIIDNAALRGCEHRVLLTAFGETLDISRDEGLQRLQITLDDDLPHVRDVEQAGGLTGMAVLLEDAGELQRHAGAGEGHQPGAELDVQVGQRCACGWVGGIAHRRATPVAAPRQWAAAGGVWSAAL